MIHDSGTTRKEKCGYWTAVKTGSPTPPLLTSSSSGPRQMMGWEDSSWRKAWRDSRLPRLRASSLWGPQWREWSSWTQWLVSVFASYPKYLCCCPPGGARGEHAAWGEGLQRTLLLSQQRSLRNSLGLPGGRGVLCGHGQELRPGQETVRSTSRS